MLIQKPRAMVVHKRDHRRTKRGDSWITAPLSSRLGVLHRPRQSRGPRLGRGEKLVNLSSGCAISLWTTAGGREVGSCRRACRRASHVVSKDMKKQNESYAMLALELLLRVVKLLLSLGSTTQDMDARCWSGGAAMEVSCASRDKDSGTGDS